MHNLKAGMAKIVITPPVGSRLSGYSCRQAPSTGVLDELYARALVVDNGQSKLALVVCDLVWVPKDIVIRSRDRIKELCGLQASEAMICGIHTHTGPEMDNIHASYLDDLVDKIAGAVYAALNRLTDVRVGWAQGSCLAGVNRRLPKAPRTPYSLYTDPDGIFDPTVAVLKIDDLSGREMGVLFNYACHPVCLGWEELRISKDFLHFTHGVLEKEGNSDYVSMFLQGCSGNVNPRWQWDKPDLSPVPMSVWPKDAASRLVETRRIGQMLGAEVLKVLASITRYETDLKLGASSRTVTLPVREDMPEPMKKLLAERAQHCPQTAGKPENAYRQVASGKKTLETEVQVFRIGACVLIALPGEVFVDYQIDLRTRIKSPLVLVSELANDEIFYVPAAYAYKQGGYEVHYSMLPPQGGKLLVDSAVEQAEQLL